jgi:hypothetical protein
MPLSAQVIPEGCRFQRTAQQCLLERYSVIVLFECVVLLYRTDQTLWQWKRRGALLLQAQSEDESVSWSRPSALVIVE